MSQYSFVDEEPTKGRYSFVEEPKKGSGNPFIDAALGLGRAARDVIDGPAYLLEKGVRAISPSAAGAVNQAGGALGMDTRPVSDINAEAERQYQDATPGSFTAGTARVAGNVLGAFMPGTGQISAARKANQLWSAGGAANKALSLGAAGGLGAAQSALMNTKTDQDSFTNNAIGGGLGAGAGQIGTAALGSMYRGARGALQGETGLAGRVLADVAEDPASVLARLKAGRELVPGSKPMTHQLAEDAGISQLARTAKTAGATGLTDREISQNLARVSVLRDLAGDEGKMAAAINARTSRAGPLYGVAKDVVVPVDDQLKALLDRPSMQAAVKRAERLAQESGQKLDLSGEVNGGVLHHLKMGIDDLLKDPTSGMAANERRAVTSTRDSFMNWVENRIPEYKAGREAWAELTKPIDQMKVGQRIYDKTTKALAEGSDAQRILPDRFANILRDEESLVRQATKFKGSKGLTGLLTPEQIGSLESVRLDLNRAGIGENLGRVSGSDTAQKALSAGVLDSSVVRSALRLIPGASTIGSPLLDAMSASKRKAKADLIARALLDPEMAASGLSMALKNSSPGWWDKASSGLIAAQVPAMSGLLSYER